MKALIRHLGQPIDSAANHPRNKIVLFVLSLGAFMASLDVFIVNVAFEDIGADFHGVALSQLSWVLNAYTIIYAALLVPAGRLTDRYGRKAGFITGLGLFTAASAACAAADGIWWLVAFRALQAVGAAILTPASLGLVVALMPPADRERSVRIWAAAGALAAALGPAVGGILVEVSWRWVFLVNVPVGLVALLAAAIVIAPVHDDEKPQLPDLLGSVLLTIAIGALTLGLVEGSEWGWTDPRITAAWVISAAALAGFVISSTRHPEPVIAPALIRVRTFSWANLTAVLFSIPFAGALLSNILWLQQVWGYSALKTGFAVSPGPLMVPVFAVLAHGLARRVPVGRIVSAGCLLFGAGGVILAMSMSQTPAYATAILPGWLIGGAGVGLALPAILSSATADLPNSQAATGSAVINMSRQIGTVLGVSMLVAIVATPTDYPTAHDAFQHAWWALTAAALLGSLTALGMTPRSR